MAVYRPKPVPSQGVEAGEVAVATNVQLRRAGQASGQAAGQVGASRTVTSATSLSSTDTFVLGDTTGGAFTITLPEIAEYSRMFAFVKRYAGVADLTVAARGSDTIDGAASNTVTTMVLVFPRTNSDWHMVAVEN